MTSRNQLREEKARFRRIMIGIASGIALVFLLIGLSFYLTLAEQLRQSTHRLILQTLDKHREGFALETFLQKSGAYHLRVNQLVDEGRQVADGFSVCLYRPLTGEVIASTFDKCEPTPAAPETRNLASGVSEIVAPIDSGIQDEKVLLKVRYQDRGNIFAAVRSHPSALLVALMVLIATILGILRVLESYHRRIIGAASAMERESHTSRAIALTAKMLAHDLRKPFSMLDGVLGFLESSKSEKQFYTLAAKYLPDVRQAMKKVNLLIADIMAMGSESALNRQDVRIESLLEASLYDVFSAFPRAEVSLQFDLRHRKAVLVDNMKVLRVFENILTNAVQAMRGNGSIRISTSDCKRAGAAFVEVVIWNSGPTIPHEEHAKVFDPFVTKGKRNGTGLGLAICKQIIAQHGGEIKIESGSEAGGAAFSFMLPASALANTGKSASRLPSHSREMSRVIEPVTPNSANGSLAMYETKILETAAGLGRSLRILVADDEAIYRNVLMYQITSNPRLSEAIEFSEAPSVESAVQMSMEFDPDVIVMDIDFGDQNQNGFDAIERIKEKGVKAAFCVHTNRSQDDQGASRIASTVTLPKPISRPEFLRFLATAVAR